MKKDVDYFYGAIGIQVVELRPCRQGVEITITQPSHDGDQATTALITRETFRQLLTDGTDVLRSVDQLRDTAIRHRGYPL